MLTALIQDRIKESNWDGWLATIKDLVDGVPHTHGDVDDWYGTFNQALRIARSRGWVDWEKRGPKGRWYWATPDMAAKFSHDTQPKIPQTSEAHVSTVLICPHCKTPHQYDITLTFN
jgi:hypothetical protein